MIAICLGGALKDCSSCCRCWSCCWLLAAFMFPPDPIHTHAAVRRHTSRFLILWLLLLPLALWGSCGWGMVPAVALISFVLLGALMPDGFALELKTRKHTCAHTHCLTHPSTAASAADAWLSPPPPSCADADWLCDAGIEEIGVQVRGAMRCSDRELQRYDALASPGPQNKTLCLVSALTSSLCDTDCSANPLPLCMHTHTHKHVHTCTTHWSRPALAECCSSTAACLLLRASSSRADRGALQHPGTGEALQEGRAPHQRHDADG